jgi:DNA primase catalytic core
MRKNLGFCCLEASVARIPDAEIERLKDQVSLVSLAEAAGVQLLKIGSDFTGCCPFHEDGSPSLVISPARNLWHCLGACQAGGSVIDWVMRAEGVSFRHAVELLRDGMPVITPASRAPGRSTARKLASPVDRDAADGELLGQVVGYYHRVLKESPDVLGYLAKRKIGHPEAIDTFRLGYADRSLGLRLPDKRRKDGAEIRGRLEKLGVFRASGHEHFAGSLIVPVFDEHGSVMEVYGRKTGDHLRAGTPGALVSARPAPRRVQPGRARRQRRDHRLRVADRRADVLVRRVPARHRLLWRGRVHCRP